MQNQRKTIRVRKVTDDDPDENLKSATAAKRLGMMWQLTLDAWAFKGEQVAELRLPRHIVRVLRREG
jgi:hypothetical protein